MKPVHATFICFIFLSSFSLYPLLQKTQSQDSPFPVSQLVAEGDALVEKTFDYEKAVTKYLEALSLDSLNYEALWKISRSYRLIGENLPSITDEHKERQIQAYEEAVKYAEKAIFINPKGASGYVQRAAANSLAALFRNIWKFSSLMNDVREDCEKAIELDPMNAHAYYLLGRAHLKLSERTKLFRWPFGVAWGNRDDAIRYFERAISLQPNSILYHVDAARTYVEKKENRNAREHLSIVASLPVQSPGDERLRKEAADLFEKIKNK